MILGVLSVGLTSTGAVLEPVLGQPMLARQLERLGRSRRMDALVVVTGVSGRDEEVASLCRDLQVPCLRSEAGADLDRVYEAARACSPRDVVCLTARSPLSDPALIDEVIGEHLDGDHDFTSTVPPPTYPGGLEVDVVRFSCLEDAIARAASTERAEVVQFLRAHPEQYAMGVVSAESDYSRHCWAVEEAADVELIGRIFESLYREDPEFSWRDVLALVERDEDWTVLRAGPGASEEVEDDEREQEEGGISA